jgi:hypothetical protein
MAQAMRERIRRQGYVGRGFQLWSKREDDIVLKLYPDYNALVKAFRRKRTYYAIRNRARLLGATPRRHVWTARELSRLRSLYPHASRELLLAELPGLSWSQIIAQARHHGFRRARRYVGTGDPVLDAIRQRCLELGYTMPDLDALSRSKRYFASADWFNKSKVTHGALLRAVHALGGTLSVRWE